MNENFVDMKHDKKNMYIFVAVGSCAWIYFCCCRPRRKRNILASPKTKTTQLSWREFLLQELEEASVPYQQQCLEELSSMAQ